MTMAYLASLANAWTSLLHRHVVEHEAKHKDISKEILLDTVMNAERILGKFKQQLLEEEKAHDSSRI